MQRTIARHGTNRYFLVFNFSDHSHIIFEEASAQFVPNTCPAIPVESIHCLWVLVWPAYIKPSKTVDSCRKPSTAVKNRQQPSKTIDSHRKLSTDYIIPATHYVKPSKTIDPSHTQCNSGPFHIYSRVLYGWFTRVTVQGSRPKILLFSHQSFLLFFYYSFYLFCI